MFKKSRIKFTDVTAGVAKDLLNIGLVCDAVLTDFDNDGWKDVHITNGMGKDMLNSDYLFFRNDFATSGSFTNIAERNKVVVNKLNEYGAVELNNYVFHNNKDFTFTNKGYFFSSCCALEVSVA